MKLDTQLLNQREFRVTVSPQTSILMPFNSHCANREPDMSVVKPHLLQLPPQSHSCLRQMQFQYLPSAYFNKQPKCQIHSGLLLLKLEKSL